MPRRSDTSLPGGAVSTTTGRGGGETPSIQATSPATSSAKNLEGTVAGSTGAPTGGAGSSLSYLASSAQRSQMTRNGSLLALGNRPYTRARQKELGRWSSDNIDITQTKIENSTFVPISENGISNFRPEIIATIDFAPIWKPGRIEFNSQLYQSNSPIGEFLNFQYQTKHLRQETLQALITNIKNELKTDPFTEIKKDFQDQITNIQKDLNFLNTIVDNIQTINSSVDIKNIPDNDYVLGNRPIPTLRRFATTVMQYNDTQYDNFSETKIILQMLFDLTNILSDYSVNLLNVRDNDRISDKSPSNIDTTYTLQDGFTFSIKNFRSSSELTNALNIFEQFTQSIPEQPDSVIKLLTYLISKEFLVSTGLGNVSNQDIINKYRSNNVISLVGIQTTDDSDIFQNILGKVGSTIFEKPEGAPDSLASLMYVDPGLGRNYVVLPFENRYITSNDRTVTYVPGTSYFSDSIITTNNSNWNIQPYVDFAEAFSKKYSDAYSAISKLLSLRNLGQNMLLNFFASTTIVNSISPVEFNRLLVESFQASFDKLSTDEQNVFKTNEDIRQQIKTLKQEIINIIPNIRAAVQQVNSLRGFQDELDIWRVFDPLGVIGNPLQQARNSEEEQMLGVINSLKSEIQAKIDQIKLLGIELGKIKISSEQALIVALYNKAGADPQLKKFLFTLALLTGIWRNTNTSTRMDFFDYLTKNEYKKLGDIIDYVRQTNSDTDTREATAAQIALLESFRTLPLNPSATDFNSGKLQIAIILFINTVIGPYIKNLLLKTQGPANPRGRDITRPVDDNTTEANNSLEVPALSLNKLNDSLWRLISGTGPGRAAGSFQVSLFNQIITLTERLFDSTKQSEQVIYITPDGRTKYNKLSLSTQFLLIHEIYVQYAKKYSTIKLKGLKSLPADLSDASINDQLQSALNDAGTNDAATLNRAFGNDVENFFSTLFGLNNSQTTESPPQPGPVVETYNDFINIAIDLNKQDALDAGFSLIKSGNPVDVAELTDPSQNTLEYHDLYDNHLKIKNEFDCIINALGIFGVINKRIQNAKNVISNFFRQNTLAQFLRDSSITNLDNVKYISQLRLSTLIYNDIKERIVYSDSLVSLPGGANKTANIVNDPTQLIVSDTIIPSEYNSLISYLSQQITPRLQIVPTTELLNKTIQRNNKIVTIGIPAGFSKQLADRVTVNQFNRQGAQGKQSDVIAINIFPNDIRFGEIVLKPITYIFDLSLFVTKKEFYDADVKIGEDFSNILARIKVKDLENTNSIKSLSRNDLVTDSRYSFLTTTQRRDLFDSLVTSYLFGVYLNCLTGIRYSEDIFLTPESNRVLNGKSLNVLNSYLAKINQTTVRGYTNTEDILINPDLTESIKDAYRLMTYGSMIFNQNEAIRRINSSKIFDRVFNLPVYLGASEIDIDATNSTESGRLALEKPSVQRYIVNSTLLPGKKYLVTNEPDDFIIKDVFFAALTNDTGTGVGLDWTRASTATSSTNNNSTSTGPTIPFFLPTLFRTT